MNNKLVLYIRKETPKMEFALNQENKIVAVDAAAANDSKGPRWTSIELLFNMGLIRKETKSKLSKEASLIHNAIDLTFFTVEQAEDFLRVLLRRDNLDFRLRELLQNLLPENISTLTFMNIAIELITSGAWVPHGHDSEFEKNLQDALRALAGTEVTQEVLTEKMDEFFSKKEKPNSIPKLYSVSQLLGEAPTIHVRNMKRNARDEGAAHSTEKKRKETYVEEMDENED